MTVVSELGPALVRARETGAASAGAVRAPEENGAGDGIRTRDVDLGKVALYH